MIVKIQLTQSEGLPVGVLMHDQRHRLVQKITDGEWVKAAIDILRGEPHVHLIGSVINGAFEPEAHVTGQNW